MHRLSKLTSRYWMSILGILLLINTLCFVSLLQQQTYGNTQGENWLLKCKTIEDFLVNSCDIYVNPDGSLTQEGVRTNNCIINGGILGGGSWVFSKGTLPLQSIVDGLSFLAPLTNCGNIVDFVKLRQATDPMSLLNVLGIGKSTSFPLQAGQEQCGKVINGDFSLATDLNCPTDALIIGTDNVVINLNNHSINGPGTTSEKVGISVPHHTNIRIHGPGAINNFQAGILISGSENTSVQGLTLQGNKIAIFLTGASGTTVEQNFIDSNAIGVASHSSVGAQLHANIMTGNQLAGVTLVNTDSFNIDANSIGGSKNGVYLDSQSTKNTVINNKALKNDIDINNADGLPFGVNGNKIPNNQCFISNPSGGCNPPK